MAKRRKTLRMISMLSSIPRRFMRITRNMRRRLGAGLPILTRAELLGQLMRNYRQAVAVAGTHGKTTTTSMLTEILLDAHKDPTVSVGGMMDAIGGNIRVGSADLFVTEACEYTNSFLSFYPTMGIILNIEADHLDFFKDIEDIRRSFRRFAKLLPEDGVLIINSDIRDYKEITKGIAARVVTVGSDPKASDYSAANIQFNEEACAAYELLVHGKPVQTIALGTPGMHNVYNSLAAAAAAHELGITGQEIETGLLRFHGTHRRFEKKGRNRRGYGDRRLCPSSPGDRSDAFCGGPLSPSGNLVRVSAAYLF